MSIYKVTQRVIDLVEQLFAAGYEGYAIFSANYCNGTNNILDGAFAVQLTGFCKETLNIVESDDGQIVFVGRYEEERRDEAASVDDIVAIAWSMYRSYRDSGYSMPHEFKELFLKRGYIAKRTRVVEELIEKDHP